MKTTVRERERHLSPHLNRPKRSRVCYVFVSSCDMGRFPSARVLIGVLLAAALAGGCASSQSTQSSEAARAAALGTWRYQVEGAAPLNRGFFQITLRDGRLQGLVRDRRRGRLRARVDLRNSRLELVVDEMRISGYIEDGTFTAFLRPQRWSVTTTQRRGRYRQQTRSVSLYAERVRSAAAADTPSILDCESILREADGCP